MVRRALLNKRGVSLLEMIVSLTILLVVSLALLQSTLIAMNTNVQNTVRDEALHVAEMKLTELRNKNFDNLLPCSLSAEPPDVVRTVRNFTVTYKLQKQIDDVSDANNVKKQITVKVDWTLRNKPYTFNIMTTVRK